MSFYNKLFAAQQRARHKYPKEYVLMNTKTMRVMAHDASLLVLLNKHDEKIRSKSCMLIGPEVVRI